MAGNVAATVGAWDERDIWRQKLTLLGVKKKPGRSCVIINGEMREFMVEDKQASVQIKNILRSLRETITKNYGYEADTSCVLRYFSSKKKAVDHLWEHSEKLALAAALSETNLREIFITKNLRMCLDCHTATKLISKYTQKIIKIKDNKRTHIFKDGKCNCNDKY